MIDHDTYMRIHAIHRGRVVVTRDGYKPRMGELVAWLAPKRYEARVQFDGAERPLTIRLNRYDVEPLRNVRRTTPPRTGRYGRTA